MSFSYPIYKIDIDIPEAYVYTDYNTEVHYVSWHPRLNKQSITIMNGETINLDHMSDTSNAKSSEITPTLSLSNYTLTLTFVITHTGGTPYIKSAGSVTMSCAIYR